VYKAMQSFVESDDPFSGSTPPLSAGNGCIMRLAPVPMFNAHDHNADTTAAITGQLAGAYYGVGGIPTDWLEKLTGREMIEGFALDLHRSNIS